MSTGVVVLLVVLIIFVVAPLVLIMYVSHKAKGFATAVEAAVKTAGCCMAPDNKSFVVGSGPNTACPTWAPTWQAGPCPTPAL